MKCQILFSRKNKKNISKCLLKFLPSMQSIKLTYNEPVSVYLGEIYKIILQAKTSNRNCNGAEGDGTT